MKIYRTDLETGFNQKLFDINADQFQSDHTEFYSKKIDGILSIDRMSKGYHVNGKLNVPYMFTCDRCLTKFHKLKEIIFDFILTENNELNNNNSDDVVFFSENEQEYDLKPLFQELISLELQMKMICNEDCIGLCSTCGTNLNENKCDCSGELDNNPWNALKNLKS